jgi:hypothetical protein
MLDKLLPERTFEDILSGRIVVKLDGQDYILPVLGRRETRAWRAKLVERLGVLFTDLGDNVSAMLGTLTASSDRMVEMLRLYDGTGVLPDDEALDEATDPEILVAFLSVGAAAFPEVAAVIEGFRRLPENVKSEMIGAMRSEIETSASPSSSSPPSTAGRRRKSKAS